MFNECSLRKMIKEAINDLHHYSVNPVEKLYPNEEMWLIVGDKDYGYVNTRKYKTKIKLKPNAKIFNLEEIEKYLRKFMPHMMEDWNDYIPFGWWLTQKRFHNLIDILWTATSNDKKNGKKMFQYFDDKIDNSDAIIGKEAGAPEVTSMWVRNQDSLIVDNRIGV